MRAAAVQLNSTEDVDRNLATADRLVRAAAGLGAELVVLPEKWSVLGTHEQMAEGAEPLDGALPDLGPRGRPGTRPRPGRRLDRRARRARREAVEHQRPLRS